MLSTCSLCYAFFSLIAIKIVSTLFKYFVRSSKVKKYGEWAVVTGATDGIGQAYAMELARQGLNIVLISRTESKLQETAAEIEKATGRKTMILKVDFKDFTPAAQNKVAAVTNKLDIGVLINNVGISYKHPQYSLEVNPGVYEEILALNVHSVVKMSHLILPGMVERKRGAIVNISSSSSTFGCPLLSYYGASKAYINTLSRAMNAEYRDQGIHVQAQCPNLIVSKLSKIRKKSLFIPSPSEYARSGVRFIGHEAVVSPYWAHALQDFVIGLLPETWQLKMIYNMHRSIRKKALKKEGEKGVKAK